jgi:hypothetical protein
VTESGRGRQARQALADRTHRYRAPAPVLFAALTTELGGWLRLAPGEVRPRILEAVPATRVVWSSFWPASPDDTIELDLADVGREETLIRLRWFTTNPPDDRGIGFTRQRLNLKLGGDLRGVVADDNWS